MTAGHIGNRHSGLGRFLHKRHLLFGCVPPAALNPGKHFDSISIVRHSRKTRRTPSSYLMRLCPVQMGAAPTPEISIKRIVVTNKSQVLKQLDQLNINESTVFPYIENSAKYIAQKFAFSGSR